MAADGATCWFIRWAVRPGIFGLTTWLAVGCVIGSAAGCLVGCAAGPPAWSGWAAREGGLSDGPPPPAIVGACALLATPLSHVRVLASNRPCAYAWPDGDIFVTRGLVSLLGEDELAAVLAHEMGHLLGGGRRATASGDPHALAGSGDVEEQADAGACDL